MMKRAFGQALKILRRILGKASLLKFMVFSIFKSKINVSYHKSEIFVLVPKDFEDKSLNHGGSTKDITSLIQEIQSRGKNVKTIALSRSFLGAVYQFYLNRALLQEVRCSSSIIVSIPGQSGILLSWLALQTKSKMIFRSHNAELLHRIDWFKVEKKLQNKIRALKKMTFGFIGDFLASLFADEIWSISDYEVAHYWKKIFFFSESKIHFFPYFPPQRNILEINQQKNPDYVSIIGAASKGTAISLPSESFCLQGNRIKLICETLNLRLISLGSDSFFEFCHLNFGYVPQVDKIIENTKVVLIPTSFGGGFKTKIGDAIVNNQNVIVESTLHKKLGIWASQVREISSWSELNQSDLIYSVNVRKTDKFISSIRQMRYTLIDNLP
jgi:hypothetical protein